MYTVFIITAAREVQNIRISKTKQKYKLMEAELYLLSPKSCGFNCIPNAAYLPKPK